MRCLARVVLIQDLLADTLEHLTREGAAKRPRDVEGLEDVAHLIRLLCQEALLELRGNITEQVNTRVKNGYFDLDVLICAERRLQDIVYIITLLWWGAHLHLQRHRTSA